jgi:DNA invertase Pin-like site-specific DNA recombinase
MRKEIRCETTPTYPSDHTRTSAAATAVRAHRASSRSGPRLGIRSRNGNAMSVIGYASSAAGSRGRDLKRQGDAIVEACERRGLALTEVVKDRQPASHKGLSRPGLAYVFDRIASGHCSGLVVADLARITHSAAELGAIMEWLTTVEARLVAAHPAFDTDREDGRLAASMLIEVSRWERTRISERTRNGLEAARLRGKSTGRGAVTDDPALSDRITQMRAQGMTLQAIADRLNEEGVPTVRGGAKWRHSSVQAAAGYRRRREQVLPVLPVSLPMPSSAVSSPAST